MKFPSGPPVIPAKILKAVLLVGDDIERSSALSGLSQINPPIEPKVFLDALESGKPMERRRRSRIGGPAVHEPHREERHPHHHRRARRP